MKIIGYERKTGTFNDKSGFERAYDNMYVYCTYKTSNTVGEACKEYKLSKECHLNGGYTLDDLIGCEVDLSTVTTRYENKTVVMVTGIYLRN